MVDVVVAVSYVVLGAILGAAGQGARSVIGIKKRADEAAANSEEFKDWFDMKRLILSLIIGAIAGSLAGIFFLGADINKQLLLGIVAAGYSGTDFIEGLISRYTSPIPPEP